VVSGRIIPAVRLTDYTSGIAQYCDRTQTAKYKVTRHRAVLRSTYQHTPKTQIVTWIPWFYTNNICSKHFRFHFADQYVACSGTVLLSSCV